MTPELWTVLVATAVLTTVALLWQLLPTLGQLKRTLVAAEDLLVTVRRDLGPAMQDVAQVAARANEALEVVDQQVEHAVHLAGRVEEGLVETGVRAGHWVDHSLKWATSLKAGVVRGIEVMRNGNERSS